MTAAHCLRNHNSNFQILLGQSHLNSETFGQYRQLVSISRVEQHPKYDNKAGKLLKDLVIYENVVKFIYSEKAIQNFAKSSPYFCPMYVVPVKSKVKISQNFVAFSECMNFMPLKIPPKLVFDLLNTSDICKLFPFYVLVYLV